MWLIAAALAAPPGPILATPEGPDAIQLYKEQATARSEIGMRSLLACDELHATLLVCYRVEEDGKRRYVTHADLVAWDVPPTELAGLAAKALSESPLQAHDLEGATWYDAPGPKGPTVLLHPDWLGAVGDRVLVAVPARDALLVWRSDGGELDTIMTVGARKMFDELDHPVSATVLAWDGTAWSEWGKATPR